MKTTVLDPLIEEADELRLDVSSLEKLKPRIPPDREAIEALLHEAIAGYRARAFTLLTLAAVDAEIPVDASILAHGARLLPHPGFMLRLGVRLSGDVAGALVAAVEDGRLSWEKEAVALYLAAWWSRERQTTTHKRAIVRRARMLTRQPTSVEVQAILVAAAAVLDDPELDVLVSRLMSARFPKEAERSAAAMIEEAHGPLISASDAEDIVLTAGTRRRAVPRVGRNEPCPCGSGKKYKRCCFEKDQDRLRDSSDVVGVTQEEMRRELEDFLTLERLRELRAYEIVRLDPTRIDPGLYRPMLDRLITFGELDAVKQFFDTVGVEGLENELIDALAKAIEESKLDEARAFLEIYDPPEEPWFGFPVRFLKRNLDGGEALKILEEEARAAVDGDRFSLAVDLLESPWPSLGILVARGAAPLESPLARDAIFETLGKARDRLDLPAVDPTEHIHEFWGWEDELDEVESETPSTPSVEQRDDSARRELEAKEAELGRLRQELSSLRSQLKSHAQEVAPSRKPLPARTEERDEPRDDRVLELKERVGRLKRELNQRHAERNQLKRQLEREQKRAESLEAERESSAQPATEARADDEPSAPELDPSVSLPFRFPVFTKRFRASLQHLPDSTKRRSLVLASRIAAGDQAAFRGIRRLEVDRTLWRRRVGRDYRMLFRLGDEELEVVDIVHRQGLERALRDLT